MGELTKGLLKMLEALTEEQRKDLIEEIWKSPLYRPILADQVRVELGSLELKQQTEKFRTGDLSLELRPYESIPETPTNGAQYNLSAKERGKQARVNYIKNLQAKGIKVANLNGQWAKTKDEGWIGLPFATERQMNRWFLGLPEEEVKNRIQNGNLKAVVLLCQSNTGELLDFVIEPDLMKKAIPYLSKSMGQLKFNLRKTGDTYHLLISNDVIDLTSGLHQNI